MTTETLKKLISFYSPHKLLIGLLAIYTAKKRYAKARAMFTTIQREISDLSIDGVVITDEFVGSAAIQDLTSIANEMFASNDTLSVVGSKFVRNFKGLAHSIFLDEKTLPYSKLLELLYASDLFKSLELHLGCECYCRSVAVFKTCGNGVKPEGSMLFHRDGHPPYSYKILIYLTDVNNKSGPTSVIRKTVRNSIPGFGAVGRSRPLLIDEYFANAVCGKAGTAMLFNVNVQHAGGRTEIGERIIATFVIQPKYESGIELLMSSEKREFGKLEYDYL